MNVLSKKTERSSRRKILGSSTVGLAELFRSGKIDKTDFLVLNIINA